MEQVESNHDPNTKSEMRENFYQRFKNSAMLTQQKYQDLIKEIKEMKLKACRKRTLREMWLCENYEILTVDNVENLIAPMDARDTDILFYIVQEDLFEVLYNTHMSLEHGDTNRMVEAISKCYRNICEGSIRLFSSICDVCQYRSLPPSKEERNTNETFEVNNCQVDILDFRLHPDGNYKFAMVYEDLLTNFVVLKPLVSNDPKEVAGELLKIFLLFGPSSIVKSNQDKHFCNEIAENLQLLWPNLNVMVYDYKSNKRRTDREFELTLTDWVRENPTRNWSKQLGFLQFQNNSTYDPSLRKKPLDAMFGFAYSKRLSTEVLPKDKYASSKDNDNSVNYIEEEYMYSDEYRPNEEYSLNAEYSPDYEHRPNATYSPDYEYSPINKFRSNNENSHNYEYRPNAEYKPIDEYRPIAEYSPNYEYSPNNEYRPIRNYYGYSELSVDLNQVFGVDSNYSGQSNLYPNFMLASKADNETVEFCPKRIRLF